MVLTRHHAAAFVAATVAALVGNALLQLSLDALRVSGDGGGAPWWVTAEIVERGRWVAFAALLYTAAPALLDTEHPSTMPADPVGPAAAVLPRSAAWRSVGVSVLLVPLLWILATWLVTAMRITMLGSWATEGQVFQSAGYYRGLTLGYVPWLMAGGVVYGIAGHLSSFE